MNVEYLVELLNNRLRTLYLAKDQAFSTGDLDRINTLDGEISGVNDTLYKLKLLQGITAAAAVAGTTAADVVTSGIDALAAQANAVTAATQVLQRYDITSYATDPDHERKIYTILSNMPVPLNVPSGIDSYIQQVAPSAPVTGAMVMGAAQLYAVDERLMLALMQNDSQFGTVGVAVATMNPGNVGNTGSATRTYNSWAEGVVAVAEWLSRHHKVVIAVEGTKETPVVFDTVSTSTLPVTPAPESPSTTTASVLEASTSTPPVVDIPTSTPQVVVETPTSTPPLVEVAPTSTPPSPEVATSTPPTEIVSASSTPEVPAESSSSSVSTSTTL